MQKPDTAPTAIVGLLVLMLHRDDETGEPSWELGKVTKHHAKAKKYNYRVKWDHGESPQKLDLADYYAPPEAPAGAANDTGRAPSNRACMKLPGPL